MASYSVALIFSVERIEFVLGGSGHISKDGAQWDDCAVLVTVARQLGELGVWGRVSGWMLIDDQYDKVAAEGARFRPRGRGGGVGKVMDSRRRGNVMEGWLGSIVELEDAKL